MFTKLRKIHSKNERGQSSQTESWIYFWGVTIFILSSLQQNWFRLLVLLFVPVAGICSSHTFVGGRNGLSLLDSCASSRGAGFFVFLLSSLSSFAHSLYFCSPLLCFSSFYLEEGSLCKLVWLETHCSPGCPQTHTNPQRLAPVFWTKDITTMLL